MVLIIVGLFVFLALISTGMTWAGLNGFQIERLNWQLLATVWLLWLALTVVHATEMGDTP